MVINSIQHRISLNTFLFVCSAYDFSIHDYQHFNVHHSNINTIYKLQEFFRLIFCLIEKLIHKWKISVTFPWIKNAKKDKITDYFLQIEINILQKCTLDHYFQCVLKIRISYSQITLIKPELLYFVQCKLIKKKNTKLQKSYFEHFFLSRNIFALILFVFVRNSFIYTISN